MTDQELLELAAKAADIKVYESTDGTVQNRPVFVFLSGGGMGTMQHEERWNPLSDDAQALRLAVKLEMFLDLTIAMRKDANVDANTSTEDCNTDPCAATRRAIVRAAAEIGKSMEVTK